VLLVLLVLGWLQGPWVRWAALQLQLVQHQQLVRQQQLGAPLQQGLLLLLLVQLRQQRVLWCRAQELGERLVGLDGRWQEVPWRQAG
jgi:hypothetical protein